jgi:mRNA-degrading endonuclease RelE of RelBE toxin-antitoxin system
MKIIQSRSFAHNAKKFRETEKIILDDHVRTIADNPTIGEEKKGDLRGVFVHKFKIKNMQYLISYRVVEDTLELLMIGPHENYYRDLKDYLKSR